MNWKIPPAISNWKNIKGAYQTVYRFSAALSSLFLYSQTSLTLIGYTIPLDKRLAADGRNLQEVLLRASCLWPLAALLSPYVPRLVSPA
jgi:hypothetical protein